MYRSSIRCYCAFCRSQRLVYRKKHVSMVDIGLSGAASLLLSQIVWQDFDPRAVVFFALGLGFSEIFIQFRWRLSISCPHCGFDPVLYKKNAQAAVAKVKAHMDRRREDPIAIFNPPPRLPVIVKKASDTKKPSDAKKPVPNRAEKGIRV